MIKEEKESTEAEVERRIYEVGFHIVPSVPLEEVGTEFSTLKDLIIKSKGVVLSESAPRMMQLSYIISQEKSGKYTRHSQAYFGWIKFEGDPENILVIDKYCKNNTKILRYLIIKTVKDSTINNSKILSYSKNKGSDYVKKTDLKEEVMEKVEISDKEIDKALDSPIITE